MKDKSWIIIFIMGIALTISLVYSIIVSQKAKNSQSSHTVTTTSIIEMTATTATIKNTLTGTGKTEYKRLVEENKSQENTTENQEIQNTSEQNVEDNDNQDNRVFQIVLSINQEDLSKVRKEQKVEVSIKKEDQILNYLGKVKLINQKTNGQSIITVVIENVDEKLEEGVEAICTLIVEEATDVVALPIEAIQKRDDKTFVELVQEDGSTKELEIETGISDDYYVEITEGLTVGDRVQIVKSTTTVTN